MTLVATDGHRLALVTVTRDAGKGDEIKAILPRKTLAELGRLLADSDRDVEYERGENHLFFRHRPAAADLAHDRRPVSGLRESHSEGQRQAHRVRDAIA